MVENYRMLHYSESRDISGLSLGQPDELYALQILSHSSIEQILILPVDMVMVHYSILQNLEYFDRYPDSLVMALSRVGGLLALLKIGFFLRLFHRAHFEV